MFTARAVGVWVGVRVDVRVGVWVHGLKGVVVGSWVRGYMDGRMCMDG